MSPREVIWRLTCYARDLTDRVRFASGVFPSFEDALGEKGGESFSPGFRVTDLEVGEWSRCRAEVQEGTWYSALIERSDRILHHRLTFFNFDGLDLGDPIDWNKNYGTGRRCPLKFSAAIDYRDFSTVGDCKVVWEPNRHHHLVVLGRAYRASGDIRYAEEIVRQIGSWLDQCPFARGMNWRSPLELGIRLINWVWAIDLIREAKLFSGAFRDKVLHSVYLHLWEITRKYSRGSSANNHLIGEAAGVFIASSYFGQFRNASKWRAEAYQILSREIIRQTYGDGCSREQALGYHLFVLQFFLTSGLVGRWTGTEFPQKYWGRLEKMLEFVGELTEGGENLPMFGDCDDGYVLDLGGTPGDAKWLLSIGAILFKRSDFKSWSEGYPEPARWLVGSPGKNAFDEIALDGLDEELSSKAFPDSGYYLLQCGKKKSADRISVIFDCGELGFGSIAAHGHADALSFTLRAFGKDIFIDPGTYDYFSYPEWRNHFRSTKAHNTLTVDDEDQSVMLGPFMWGKRANSRCVKWEQKANGVIVTGEHDGYSRLDNPVIHRRTLSLDGGSRILKVRDEITARRHHNISLYWHLSAFCVPKQMGPNGFEIQCGKGRMALSIDKRFSVHLLSGNKKPISGWFSRGYHQKSRVSMIIGRCISDGSEIFECTLEVDGINESG